MPKRKREDDSVLSLFARFRTDLFSALKSAKGFERQRQSKRLRDARSTPDKRERIEKEIVVLKSLDLQQAAHAHLCSSLLRFKVIAESEKVPEEIKRGVVKPELTEEERGLLHNVTSSLYNRVEVKRVVERAVEGVCKAIGVAVPERKGKRKGREKEKGRDGEEKAVKGEKSLGGEEKKRKKVEKDRDEVVGDCEVEKPMKKESGKDKAHQKEDQEIDEEDEEKAISQLDDLLGLGSSDDEDDGEEEEVLVKGRRKPVSTSMELDPMEITTDEEAGESSDEDEFEGSGDSDEEEFEGFSDSNQDARLASDSEDDDISDAESSASSIARSPPKKKPATSTSKTTRLKPTDSTFLPTLMGGYISGSESASDIDMAPARKNRRGQRARQKIWEKKYKETAKHLQNQGGKGRDAGWDLKRGAVDGDSKPWKRGIRNPLLDKSKGPGAGAGAGAREAAPPKRTRDDTGPLHPSWEAKRLAKEKEKLTAPFQGKKITFD